MKKIIFNTAIAAIMMLLTVSCASKKEIGEGSTLEDLLKRYPKYSIEIYYSEMGSYEYDSVEAMLKGYGGGDWSGAFNDWAIFTPLNSDGEMEEVRYFLMLKDLDNRSKYQKETTVWFVLDEDALEAIQEWDDDDASNPAPPPPNIIVGTWRAPVKPGHVAYLEIDVDGMSGLYLGDADSNELYEIYRGVVWPADDVDMEGEDVDYLIKMDFDLSWYIYESDGAPITGVPASYKGTYTLRVFWDDDKHKLLLKANDDADPLFGRKELIMERSPKTEDSGHMVDLES